jgi:hypothetical protein
MRKPKSDHQAKAEEKPRRMAHQRWGRGFLVRKLLDLAD